MLSFLPSICWHKLVRIHRGSAGPRPHVFNSYTFELSVEVLRREQLLRLEKLQGRREISARLLLFETQPRVWRHDHDWSWQSLPEGEAAVTNACDDHSVNMWWRLSVPDDLWLHSTNSQTTAEERHKITSRLKKKTLIWFRKKNPLLSQNGEIHRVSQPTRLPQGRRH